MSSAEIASPIEIESLLAETEVRSVLHGVVQRLLYVNRYDVRYYDAPTFEVTKPDGQVEQERSQSLEYLAFIGKSSRNLRHPSGEQSVRLGYGYAYVSEDAENGELNTGVFIPNVRVIDAVSGFHHDRNQTMRHYTVDLKDDDADYVNRAGFKPGIAGRVWRVDHFGGLEGQGDCIDAPLPEELEAGIGEHLPNEDPVTIDFKKDMIALIRGAYEPVRPLSDRLHLYPI